MRTYVYSTTLKSKQLTMYTYVKISFALINAYTFCICSNSINFLIVKNEWEKRNKQFNSVIYKILCWWDLVGVASDIISSQNLTANSLVFWFLHSLHPVFCNDPWALHARVVLHMYPLKHKCLNMALTNTKVRDGLTWARESSRGINPTKITTNN